MAIALKARRNRKLPRREVLDADLVAVPSSHSNQKKGRLKADELLFMSTVSPSQLDCTILSELWGQDDSTTQSNNEFNIFSGASANTLPRVTISRRPSTSSNASISTFSAMTASPTAHSESKSSSRYKKEAKRRNSRDIGNVRPKSYKERLQEATKAKEENNNILMDLSNLMIIPSSLSRVEESASGSTVSSSATDIEPFENDCDPMVDSNDYKEREQDVNGTVSSWESVEDDTQDEIRTLAVIEAKDDPVDTDGVHHDDSEQPGSSANGDATTKLTESTVGNDRRASRQNGEHVPDDDLKDSDTDMNLNSNAVVTLESTVQKDDSGLISEDSSDEGTVVAAEDVPPTENGKDSDNTLTTEQQALNSTDAETCVNTSQDDGTATTACHDDFIRNATIEANANIPIAATTTSADTPLSPSCSTSSSTTTISNFFAVVKNATDASEDEDGHDPCLSLVDEDENETYDEIYGLLLPKPKQTSSSSSSDVTVRLTMTTPSKIQKKWEAHRKRHAMLNMLKNTDALNWVANGPDNDERKKDIGLVRKRQLYDKLEQPYILRKRIKSTWTENH